jgi:hypothetical protein
MIVLTVLWPRARTDHQLELRRQVAANEVLSAKNKIMAATDRSTLSQEFRIRGNYDVGSGIGLANDALDFIAGSHRYRRFGHHDGETG